jgi:hypothetical protein
VSGASRAGRDHRVEHRRVRGALDGASGHPQDDLAALEPGRHRHPLAAGVDPRRLPIPHAEPRCIVDEMQAAVRFPQEALPLAGEPDHQFAATRRPAVEHPALLHALLGVDDPLVPALAPLQAQGALLPDHTCSAAARRSAAAPDVLGPQRQRRRVPRGAIRRVPPRSNAHAPPVDTRLVRRVARDHHAVEGAECQRSRTHRRRDIDRRRHGGRRLCVLPMTVRGMNAIAPAACD